MDGAVRDALGYAVEFHSEGEICLQYGTPGIASYEFDRAFGEALTSDDAQMTPVRRRAFSLARRSA